MRRLIHFAPVLALALAPGLAFAHTGVGATGGLAHGFVHPLSGIDHLLVMIAVGVFAAQLGGRALWAVPASFVAIMAVGGMLGMAGIALPFVEVAIATSVVVLGAAIALGIDVPTLAAMALVGVFAIFHGHAHGAEMPATVSGLGYGFGFVAATAALHAVGITLGLMTAKSSILARRIGGGAMALVGVAMVAGAL